MIVYKAIVYFIFLINKVICYCSTYITFRGNNVIFSRFCTSGVPYVMVSRGGRMSIGQIFAMNNGVRGNPIGCYEKCTFFVGPTASLIIGNNVGISQSALVAINNITIGNDVKIGGGTQIFTTDFHSLDPEIRRTKNDILDRLTAPVVIKDNVFIGSRCIILKDVTIGENSIIGAGSVVTKSIPANQIWGGNPAKFIRMI